MLSLQASPRVHYAAWDCTLGGNRTRMAVRRQILTSAVYTNFTTGAERRGWDSNPCGVAAKRFSRPPRYDRFDTSPYQASSFVRTRLQRGLPNALMIIHSAAIERLYAGTIANTAQLSMRLELISAPKTGSPS